MGDHVGTDFATVSIADTRHGVPCPPRPRRPYRPRGLPLDQMPNLHLFALPERSSKPKFRQVAAPSRRTGAAWATVCIAALTTGTAVFILQPVSNDETAVFPTVLGAGSLRAPAIPVATAVETPRFDHLQRPVAPTGRVDTRSVRTTMPRLEIATPVVRVSFGPASLRGQPAPPPAKFNIPAAANAFVAPRVPDMPVAVPSDNAFTCKACKAISPALDQARIAIFASVPMGPPIGQRLRQLGASDISVDSAPIGVRQNQVRYYHVADGPAAMTLARQFGAVVVDLTWYSAAIPVGRIELWLAEPDDPI